MGLAMRYGPWGTSYVRGDAPMRTHQQPGQRLALDVQLAHNPHRLIPHAAILVSARLWFDHDLCVEGEPQERG